MTSVTDIVALQAIYDRFEAQWGTTTPFALGNEQTDLDEGSVSWVRLTVIEIGGGQNTLGNAGARRFRRSGEIKIQVFTPVNAGDRALRTLATTARNVFEGVSFSGVDCGDATRTDLGVDGKWNMAIVDTDFDYDEIK